MKKRYGLLTTIIFDAFLLNNLRKIILNIES